MTVGDVDETANVRFSPKSRAAVQQSAPAKCRTIVRQAAVHSNEVRTQRERHAYLQQMRDVRQQRAVEAAQRRALSTARLAGIRKCQRHHDPIRVLRNARTGGSGAVVMRAKRQCATTQRKAESQHNSAAELRRKTLLIIKKPSTIQRESCRSA